MLKKQLGTVYTKLGTAYTVPIMWVLINTEILYLTVH